MTPEQATSRGADVLAERDLIQANLLELDGSFAKQVLETAALTGTTGERWAAAAAAMAVLWDIYLAYAAVVDRIAALTANRRRSKSEQAELAGLLTSGCVQPSAAPAPLGQRDLIASRRPPITLVTAVGTMRRAFAEVTVVTAAAEAVWSAVGGQLDAVTESLARDRARVAGLGPDVEAAFRDAVAALGALRASVNADPLARWHSSSTGPGPGVAGAGTVDTSAADRLREEVAALSQRIDRLARLREQAGQRIAGLTAATGAARAARRDAIAARQEAATRIAALPPLPPEIPEPPAASLGALAAAADWTRLGTELGRCEADLTAAGAATEGVRRSVAAALEKRDELRALLRAYKVKAARLGAAEELDIAACYDQAHDRLWTAPCDLTEAEEAVAAYQRAILATEGRP